MGGLGLGGDIYLFGAMELVAYICPGTNRRDDVAEIECKQCGGPMKKTTKTDSNLGVHAFGCAIFIVGMALLFVFPIGTIVGIFLMIGAGTMVIRNRKSGSAVSADISSSVRRGT